MELNLVGKVAIVTGSGQGVGQGIARGLASEGVKVVVNDFFQERAQLVAQEIGAAGGEALGIKADVTNWQEVVDMVAQTMKTFGAVHILVNNAGVPPPDPDGDPVAGSQTFTFDKADRSTWKKFVDVNIYGVMNCTRAVLKQMIDGKHGKIINIVSDAGRIGEARLAPYSAAKAGIIGFSKSLAKEVGRHCINVNCISLAAVPHPGLDDRRIALMCGAGMTPEQARTELEKRRMASFALYPLAQGLGRLGAVSDVSNAVVFMASDAAAFITGQVLSVNGGYSMAG